MLLVRAADRREATSRRHALGARDVSLAVRPDAVQAVVARELRSFRLERALNSTLSPPATTAASCSRSGTLERRDPAGAGRHRRRREPDLARAVRPTEADAVVGQPLMDLFDDRSHAALKGALVACVQGKWTDHPLHVTALLGDGTQLPLDLVLTPGEFENEPCVRIMVPARKRDDRQLTTELDRRGEARLGHRPAAAALLEHGCAGVAAPRRRALHGASGPTSSPSSRRDVGARASEQFVAEYADCSPSRSRPNDIAGRFGGVSFLRCSSAATHRRRSLGRAGLAQVAATGVPRRRQEDVLHLHRRPRLIAVRTPRHRRDRRRRVEPCAARAGRAATRVRSRQGRPTRACRPTTRSGSSTSRPRSWKTASGWCSSRWRACRAKTAACSTCWCACSTSRARKCCPRNSWRPPSATTC